uniref:separase n=1 Tax=Schistocephalus solidus TaxID=70667 RepID=A0A183SHD6_SCHSO
LDLVLTRHQDFLDSKCWAAVYCRGFVYWLRLRARCSSGAPVIRTVSEDSEPNVCPLFAAINVRLHGRTLVRFMLSHCEQKAGRGQSNDQAEKENKPPDSLPTKDAESKAAFWLGNQVSDGDLVNLWLGTRLLLEGSMQVAELYTLLGTVKEARAYQLELLRVAQRFHIPSWYVCIRHAQTALSLMAYTDLLAQRKWAFDLRLSQLNHICCSKTPLTEILRTRPAPDPTKTGNRSRSKQALEESSFLRTRRLQTTALTGSTHPRSGALGFHDGADDEDADQDDISMARNPLLNAAAGGLSTHFPTSPVKSTMQLTCATGCLPTGFPSPAALTAVIESSSHVAGGVARESGDTLQSRPGLLSAETCAARILYGSLWRWLEDVTTLVREEILCTDHYLPALLPSVRATVTPLSPLLPPNECLVGQPARPPESPPRVDDLAAAIADCSLTPPSVVVASTTRTAPRAPSTKAGRAGRSQLAGLCFRTPVVKPLNPDCAEKPQGRTLDRVPNAPQRLADIALSEGLVDPAPSSSLRTRSSRQREQSASLETKFARLPGDVFATPLSVRSRRAQKSPPPSEAAQATGSFVDQPSCTPRASSLCSLFAPLKQTNGSTFGSVDSRSASLKPTRSLQILRDTAPSTARKADPPKLCLFKDPEPVEPKTSSLRHAIAAARNLKSTSHRRRQQHPPNHELAEEEAEHCPSRSAQPPRPMNLRLGSRWAAAASRTKAGSPPPSEAAVRDLNAATPGWLAELARKQDVLTDRLYQAYSQLSSLPVPSLLRPICQLLGLRWLGKGDQRQAARFLSQSVGLSASSLYASILCSKMKSKTKSDNTPAELNVLSAVAVPNDLPPLLPGTPQQHPLLVLQLTLVDELGEVDLSADSAPSVTTSPKNLVPGGLGARHRAHLVATRWVMSPGGDPHCPAETSCQSRVIHGFHVNGLRSMDAFDELQTASLDSMHEVDGRRFWSQRFSLDGRLDALLRQMREDWFTKDDISWIFGQDLEHTKSLGAIPTVLILDRRLVFLPWEWIIWGGSEAANRVPTICRSFSLGLVLGQLATPRAASTFDPRSAYYVLNPEANLPHTEATFLAFIREHFASWNGIIGRMPSDKEVIQGFTQHDLFVYLGHGNGSRFLMSTFSEGLVARAVALIVGCSSGRPRLDGRHEPYASVFNHLIAGSPTVLSLLWDVTDRDIDRFTKAFLTGWLLESEQQHLDEGGDQKNLGFHIFHAVTACKLQSLVGKSVVVYGLPAGPR